MVKVSCNSVHYFVSNRADRWTDRQTNTQMTQNNLLWVGNYRWCMGVAQSMFLLHLIKSVNYS